MLGVRVGPSASSHFPLAVWEATPAGHVREHRLVFVPLSFLLEELNTLEQVMVKRLVGGQDGRHLVVVGGVDVLVNAVACKLHLPQTGREGRGQEAFPGFPGGGGRGSQGGTPARNRTFISVDNVTFSKRKNVCLFSSSTLNRLSHVPARPGSEAQSRAGK